jgi:hypothetical protein
VYLVGPVLLRLKQIIEVAVKCNFGQIRVAAPGRYKFITSTGCGGVTCNGRREDGKARRTVTVIAFNDFRNTCNG